MRNIFRIWSGYVRIKITGYAPERFMNLCKINGISLYAIHCEQNGYTLELSLRDFFYIKKLLKKTGTRIHIVKKVGLPFLFHRYRKHYFMFLAIICSIFLLILMSSILWEVDVRGNRQITDDMFVHYLEKSDIKPGIFIANLNLTNLEKQIRNDFPDIIWVSVQLDGTKLIINIQEIKDNNKDISDEEEAIYSEGTDIIASKSGTIISIVTRCGTPMIKAGDQVEEGQILVSGCMELFDDYGVIIGYDYCDAEADIVVKYDDLYKDVIQLEYDKWTPTGNFNVKKAFILKNRILTIGNPFKKYENAIINTEQSNIKIGNLIELPIKLITIKEQEVVVEKNVFTKDEIEKIAQQHLALYCKKLTKKGFQMVDKNVKIKFNDNVVSVNGTVWWQYTEYQRKETMKKELNAEEGL